MLQSWPSLVIKVPKARLIFPSNLDALLFYLRKEVRKK
nr:MAG TPA: hypothetical protein [Caudoviricetes sp.]